MITIAFNNLSLNFWKSTKSCNTENIYSFARKRNGTTTPLLCWLLISLGFANQNAVGQEFPDLGDKHPESKNYQLVWSDEFDGKGPVNSDNWHHQIQLPAGGSWFNDEEQHYTDRRDNSSVADGVLTITAKREKFTAYDETKAFTSARLNSKYAFTYGRVDVKAKLPASLGTWPAIWTLGQDINEPGGYWRATHGSTGWPAAGEIDIMEQKGVSAVAKEKVLGTIHTTANHGGKGIGGGIPLPKSTTQFHVYSIIWTPSKIQFLVDDTKYFTYDPSTLPKGKNADTWPFDSPQYLLLNIAMGGVLGGTIPESFDQDVMEVDYVRVYQKARTPE